MKKLSFVLLFVFALFAVSCKLMSDGFNASIQDFFDENLGEARITHYILPDQAGWSNGNDGYLHIPSSADFSIKLLLTNPQGYKFILGKNLCIDWQNEAVSSIFTKQETLGQLIELKSDARDKTNSMLILTFSKHFLFRCEQGVDISPVIKMSHPLSDAQFQSFDALKLKANSAPPPVSGITIYECPDPDEENKKRYLFAFNMPSRQDLLGIHHDISEIAIKIEGEDGKDVFSGQWKVHISDDGSFAFLNESNEPVDQFKYEDLTHNYTPVRTEFYSSNPVMYFSSVNISSYPEIDVYITLFDKNGLKNDSVSETTRIQCLDSVTITDKSNNVVENGAGLEQDDGERETFATICLTPPVTAHDAKGNPFYIPNQQDKIEIVYEVYEGENATGKRILHGSGSGKQTLKIPVGSLFIKAHAFLSGYVNSVPIEYTVKVSKTKLVVNADSGDDSNVGSKESPFKTILGALQAFDDITNEKNTVILESATAEKLSCENPDACFTILSQPQYTIQNGVSVTAHALSLKDITIVGSIYFTGKKLTLGHVYKANAAVKVAMKENGSSLYLTGNIAITEVELGAENQTIVLNSADLKSPIKISLADSYKTGDVILISDDASLTAASLKNFELESEKFRIELQNGNGVLAKKPQNIEITLPEITMPTGNYVFALGGEGVLGTEENIKVKINKLISFSVTKNGAELSDDNAEFEISLMQNGTLVGDIKGIKSLQVPDYVPLGDYEIHMSVKIDGIEINKTQSVAVVN